MKDSPLKAALIIERNGDLREPEARMKRGKYYEVTADTAMMEGAGRPTHDDGGTQ